MSQYSWPCHSIFYSQSLLMYQLMYGLSSSTYYVVLADQCHEMRSAAPVQCPKFTKAHNDCVVDRAVAFDICADTPGCKYVLTTINAEWNSEFSDAAMLGKDPLKNNSEWKSCEIPATPCKSLILFCCFHLLCLYYKVCAVLITIFHYPHLSHRLQRTTKRRSNRPQTLKSW